MLQITMCLFFFASWYGKMGHGWEPFYFGSLHISMMVHIIHHNENISSISFCIGFSCMCKKVLRVKVISDSICFNHAGDFYIHCSHMSMENKVLRPDSISNISLCTLISCNYIFWLSGISLSPRLYFPTIHDSQIPMGLWTKHHRKGGFSGSILHIPTQSTMLQIYKSIFNGYVHHFPLINQKVGLLLFFLALKSAEVLWLL